MPKFKVEYVTNERPTTVPAGATVTEIKALPVEFRTEFSGRLVKLYESMDELYIQVHTSPITGLNRSEARQLRDGLNEFLGEPAEATALPYAVKDKDGDYWVLDRTNGKYRWTGYLIRTVDPGDGDTALERIKDDYGPIRIEQH